MPVLTIVAGPNGGGKSTVVLHYEFEGKHNLLDTDAIAKRINPGNPLAASVAAGREVIKRTRQFIETHQSFVLETTLSGNISLSVINSAKAQGFFVNLLYIYLDDPELAIERVQERITKGGHSVPAADIRRRYGRSIENLSAILPLVDHAMIFDNSSKQQAQLLIEAKGGVILQREVNLPFRIQQLIGSLKP